MKGFFVLLQVHLVGSIQSFEELQTFFEDTVRYSHIHETLQSNPHPSNDPINLPEILEQGASLIQEIIN